MCNFLYNFDNDEILFFVELLDKQILQFEDNINSLKHLKSEFITYLSNNKEE